MCAFTAVLSVSLFNVHICPVRASLEWVYRVLYVCVCVFVFKPRSVTRLCLRVHRHVCVLRVHVECTLLLRNQKRQSKEKYKAYVYTVCLNTLLSLLLTWIYSSEFNQYTLQHQYSWFYPTYIYIYIFFFFWKQTLYHELLV